MRTADSSSNTVSPSASAAVALGSILALDFMILLQYGVLVAYPSKGERWLDSPTGVMIAAGVALAFTVRCALAARRYGVNLSAASVGFGIAAIYAAVSCCKCVAIRFMHHPATMEGSSLHLVSIRAVVYGAFAAMYAMSWWCLGRVTDREPVRSGITALTMLMMLDFAAAAWTAFRSGGSFFQPDVWVPGAVAAMLAFVAMPRRRWDIAFGVTAVLAASRAIEFWIRSLATKSRINGVAWQFEHIRAYGVAAGAFSVAWVVAVAIRAMAGRGAKQG